MNSRGTEISCGVKVLYNLTRNPGKDLYDMFLKVITNKISTNKKYRLWYPFGDYPISIEGVVKKDFPADNYNSLPAHYVFSDNTKRKCGEALRDYIRKKKLGSVVSSGRAKNVNSGNIIQTFIWVVNKQAMVDWFLAEHNKRNKKNKKGAQKGDKRKKGSGRIPQVA